MSGTDERIRAFVALDLPEPLVDAVTAWQRRALEQVPAAWAIRSGALHVTLAFLGDRSPEEIERTAAILRALEVGPLPLRLAPFAVGVPAKRPRVVAFDAESPATVALQGVLAGRLVDEGLLAPEGRPFWPHLSVARVRGRVDLGRLPPLPGAGTERVFAVRVALYRSQLRTQGPIYRSLAAIDLPPQAADEVI